MSSIDIRPIINDIAICKYHSTEPKCLVEWINIHLANKDVINCLCRNKELNRDLILNFYTNSSSDVESTCATASKPFLFY